MSKMCELLIILNSHCIGCKMLTVVLENKAEKTFCDLKK